MAKRLSILLGSWLALQSGALLKSDTQQMTRSLDQASQSAELASEIPLYHHEHALEILGQNATVGWTENNDAFSGRSIELSQFIYSKIRDLLPKPWRPKTSRIARALIETANKNHMDPLFLMAIIQHESKFDPTVIGSHGEIGLMQLKPDTARWLMGDEDASQATIAAVLHDPESNIALGAAYLAKLRTKYKGKSDLYITAYNMGQTAMRRQLAEGERPTVYLNKILTEYASLSEGIDDGLSESLTDALVAAAKQNATRSIASAETTKTLVAH